MEYTITDNIFHFYVKPYFLRLRFNQQLKSEDDYYNYDANEGTITINARKQIDGEFFANLNMITWLLAQPNKQESQQPFAQQQFASSNMKKPLIEVVSSNNMEREDEGGQIDGNGEDNVDFTSSTVKDTGDDYFAKQEPLQVNSKLIGRYGFDRQYRGFFNAYTPDALSEIIGIDYNGDLEELEDPTAIGYQKRSTEQFDVEYYANDYIEDEEIRAVLKFKPKCANRVGKWNQIEQQQLAGLPKKEIKFLEHEMSVWLSLVDILCAYCYNHRTTFGENNVESSWNVIKLSSTLCWFEEFSSIQNVVVSFIRRVLCYPLYRHWELALQSIRDTVAILRNERECVLRCLLECKYLFEHTVDTQRYLLNKLFIDDYCVWIQGQLDTKLLRLADELEQCVNLVDKSKTEGIKELELCTIEQVARECLEENGGSGSLNLQQEQEKPSQLLM